MISNEAWPDDYFFKLFENNSSAWSFFSRTQGTTDMNAWKLRKMQQNDMPYEIFIWRIEYLKILRHFSNTQEINKGELSQSAITAVQIALVNFLSVWNIRPVATVKHSSDNSRFSKRFDCLNVDVISNEIAAVYAGDFVTARYAIVLAYFREKTVARNKKHESILAINMEVKKYETNFQNYFDNVVVTCHNFPESITLSDDTNEITAAKETFEAKKIFAKILITDDNAYHSFHMKSADSIYEAKIIENCVESCIQLFQFSQISMISSVTKQSCIEKKLGAKYWQSNLESSVLFEDALMELVKTTSVDNFIEIDFHNALQSPVQQIVRSISNIEFFEYVSTLIRRNDDVENILNTAEILFAKNYSVDLKRINSIEIFDSQSNGIIDFKHGVIIIDLFRYQWQYQNINFSKNRWTRKWRQKQHSRHDFLDSRIFEKAKNDPIWRNMFRLKDISWLEDHQVNMLTSSFIS